MALRPSIKGSVLSELAEDIGKLMASRDFPQSRIEAHLTKEDLAILEAPILPSQWYDAHFYAHCAELLRDTVGAGSNGYLRKRGFEKGRKLIEAGLYQQMEYAKRTQVQSELSREARFEAYGRDLRLFVTLSGSLLNFSKWSTKPDPSHEYRYLILVEGAADYPEALAWATEGLIDSMACAHGLDDMWRHQRINSDQILFRMTRSL